jgi:DME family drug/metabolite transporter
VALRNNGRVFQDGAYQRGTLSNLTGRLLLLAAAVLFSTGGAAVKGTALNAMQVAGLRSFIAAVAILTVLPEARRGWRWRYVPVAVCYAATMILYVTATKLTTAANAIFLQGAAPFFVLLLSPLLLKERIVRSDVALMAAVACGMVLLFLSRESANLTAPDPATGNLLAGASALTWGLTIIGLRSIGRNAVAGSDAGMATAALGSLLTSAATLPFAFPFVAFHSRDAAIILWLGIFQVAMAYVFLTRGLRVVTAMEATILLLADPALNPVWTWLAHGEKPSALSLAGGSVVFLAILGKAWWQSRFGA